MLGDVGQAGTHLALQLGVAVGQHLRQVRHGALRGHGMGQLLRVLADVAQRRRADALQAHLRLLDAEHEQRHRACLHHSVRQV